MAHLWAPNAQHNSWHIVNNVYLLGGQMNKHQKQVFFFLMSAIKLSAFLILYLEMLGKKTTLGVLIVWCFLIDLACVLAYLHLKNICLLFEYAIHSYKTQKNRFLISSVTSHPVLPPGGSQVFPLSYICIQKYSGIY